MADITDEAVDSMAKLEKLIGDRFTEFYAQTGTILQVTLMMTETVDPAVSERIREDVRKKTTEFLDTLNWKGPN